MGYLQLARPANIVTAWADIAAGFAVAGLLMGLPERLDTLVWLLVATTGLYGGGVAFNDVFDADLDARERPERPIPSGKISRRHAAYFASALLAAGIAAAFVVSWISGLIALCIAAGALVYDTFAKHHPGLGPVMMGGCRGGNLLLGLSAALPVLADKWPLAFLPLLYIAGVTLLSRGEVLGGSQATSRLSVVLIVGVIAVLGRIAMEVVTHVPASGLFPFLFTAMVLPPYVQAARKPDAGTIRKAVRMGVLGLIPLNATLAALYADPIAGVAVLALLPVSLLLARLFAVT